MVPGQAEIAKVNRKTGVLYLSDAVWKGLPQEEKNFVLYHEEGHLTLQTADEFQANKYAVGKFLSAGTFTQKELGQKIMVMRSILDKADGKTSNFSSDLSSVSLGNDSLGIGAGLTAIMQGLPILGIGQKAREKETITNAAAQATIYNAQATAAAAKSKGTLTIIMIAGTLLIVGLIIYFTLRNK